MYLGTDYPLEIAEARRQAAIVAITRRSRKPAVDSKIAAIVGAPPEASQGRKHLFISESGDVPFGVVESVLRRHTEIWGRY